MDEPSTCPRCAQPNVYPDGDHLVCADCGHEWSSTEAPAADGATPEDDGVIRDVNGVALANGDSVVLIKSLKVKGSSVTLKRGTLIKNIRLTGDPAEIECNAEKVKGLVLRTEFLKKA
jgi:protein PhnA